MNDGSGASDEDFTADLVLNVSKTLSGTYRTETSGTDNLIGVAGYDTSEVRIGDVLEIPTLLVQQKKELLMLLQLQFHLLLLRQLTH